MLRFYFVAEAPQFCSYLSCDCNCYLTNTLQIDFSSNKGAKNVCFSVERSGVRKAVVANPRRDTCSREVFRHEVIFFFFFVKKGEIAFAFLLRDFAPFSTQKGLSLLPLVHVKLWLLFQDLKDRVKMSRIRDHFICKLYYAKDDCSQCTEIMTFISPRVDVTKCLSLWPEPEPKPSRSKWSSWAWGAFCYDTLRRLFGIVVISLCN